MQSPFQTNSRAANLLRIAVCFSCLLLCFCAFQVNVRSQTPPRPVSLAVLSFGDSQIGRLATETFALSLKRVNGLTVLDLDLARSAARGTGYTGSMNLSLTEARDLGSALGCDFYVLGDAQTLRRSPSTGEVYFESYASVFLISARTGRLHLWERPAHKSARSAHAEQSLLSELSGAEIRRRFEQTIHHAEEIERSERTVAFDRQTPVIELAPEDDEAAAAEGLQLPRPFRRYLPGYPDSAAQAEVEATVDVLVDLDAEGEVTRVEIARWAGFGLDQATIDTVRRLHFFPAHRNGVAVPLRVLLRYNFRKPPKE